MTAKKGESAQEFNARVVVSLKKLIDDANSAPERKTTQPNGLAGIMALAEFCIDGFLMFTQNIAVNLFFLVLLWTLTPVPLLALTLIKRKKKVQ